MTEELPKSNRQLRRERSAVIGALLKAGDKESAKALMFGRITIEEAVERLR